jgi:hypothetical protein
LPAVTLAACLLLGLLTCLLPKFLPTLTRASALANSSALLTALLQIMTALDESVCIEAEVRMNPFNTLAFNEGLSAKEVEQRIKEHGRKQFTEAFKRPPAKLRQDKKNGGIERSWRFSSFNFFGTEQDFCGEKKMAMLSSGAVQGSTGTIRERMRYGDAKNLFHRLRTPSKKRVQ